MILNPKWAILEFQLAWQPLVLRQSPSKFPWNFTLVFDLKWGGLGGTWWIYFSKQNPWMLFVNKPYGNQVRSFPNDQRSRCVWHSFLLKIVCIDSYITVWYTSVGSVASGKRCLKAGAKCKSGSKMSCNVGSKIVKVKTDNNSTNVYIYIDIQTYMPVYIHQSMRDD